MGPAKPLGEVPDIESAAREIITRAETSWLKNTDVLYILRNYKEFGLPVSTEPPVKPGGGTLFLFDKKQERYFRKDGHQWRKKANGKTVRETHEKLKVDNRDMLNCYYTHSEVLDELQRRCYWMLEEDDGIVLVHYLAGNLSRTRHSHPTPPSQASGPSRQPGSSSSRMPPPSQNRPPLRMHLNRNPVLGLKRPSQSERPSESASGPSRTEEPLPPRVQYRTGSLPALPSLPERNSEAAERELYQYGQALQAKKLAGEIIQPTAMHASAFANKPLFMAIDRQMEISQNMERLHELATQVALANQRAEEERRARSNTPAPKSNTPTSQVQSESDKAEEVKERARKARDTPFMEDAMESPGRSESQPASASSSEEEERQEAQQEEAFQPQGSEEDEGQEEEEEEEEGEPPAKRRRLPMEEREMSQEELVKCFLDSNRELLAEFKESNSVLLQHLQYQRQADDSFRRELMDMERERAKSERETLAIIASAVLGSTGRMPPPPRDPMQNLQEAAASYSRFSTGGSHPFQASNPLGALAHSMMMSGTWPPPAPRDPRDSGR